MSSWHLFLDDGREPVKRDGVFVVRNFSEAVALIKEKGIPDAMSLDHDIGDGPNGYDFLLWLTGYMMDEDLHFSDTFTFFIHSQNPVGKENMQYLLDNFVQFRRENP